MRNNFEAKNDGDDKGKWRRGVVNPVIPHPRLDFQLLMR